VRSLANFFFVTRRETLELSAAVVILALAFSYPLFPLFPLQLLALGLGVGLHELAHKFTAMNIGGRAEFKASIPGLLTSMFSSLLSMGIVKVGIPGAVHITSETPEKSYMAQIALAGPLTNMAAALLFALLKPISPLAFLIALPNASLALSNLLPVKPLDGHHVAKYSRKMWASFFAMALATMAITWI
jgi:Zn-dependent protease